MNLQTAQLLRAAVLATAFASAFFGTAAHAQGELPPPPPPPVEATTTKTTTTIVTEETQLEERAELAPAAPAPRAPRKASGAWQREPEREPERDSAQEDEWASGARFFVGARGAVGFPPGGDGLAPLGGLELGVAARKGVGFGLHVFGAGNTPGAPILSLPSTNYAFGATADLRYYLQSIAPLRLYPTLSAGFMAGPDKITGKNAVLPLLTPGFGARVNLADVYVAVELGAASFYIPFMAVSVGWEPRERIEN